MKGELILITKEEVVLFREMYDNKYYLHNETYVKNLELFLKIWLTTFTNDDSIESVYQRNRMTYLYDEFRNIFPYTGYIYRGIRGSSLYLNKELIISNRRYNDGKIVSFSSDKYVAKSFCRQDKYIMNKFTINKDYDEFKYIYLRKKVKNAFDFNRFLDYIIVNTIDKELIDLIECYVTEDEVIDYEVNYSIIEFKELS